MSATVTSTITRPMTDISRIIHRSRRTRPSRDIPNGLLAKRPIVKPTLPRRTVLHHLFVSTDAAILLVAPVEQLVGRKLHQLFKRALVGVEHGADRSRSVPVRAAHRFWDDLVDDPEFEKIFRRKFQMRCRLVRFGGIAPQNRSRGFR